MNKKKNLYETLGVDKNATAADIKKQYRKMAAENHPDKSTGDHNKMTDIVHAYQVLGDKIKRDRYDKTGEDSAAPFEKKFQEFIQLFFIKIIDSEPDVSSVDLIAKLKKQAELQLAHSKNDRKDLDLRLKKLQNVFARLEAKKENRISHILNMNIDEMKLQLGQVDEHLKFMADVIECLGSYHYNFVEPEEPKGFNVIDRRGTAGDDLDWTWLKNRM